RCRRVSELMLTGLELSSWLQWLKFCLAASIFPALKLACPVWYSCSTLLNSSSTGLIAGAGASSTAAVAAGAASAGGCSALTAGAWVCGAGAAETGFFADWHAVPMARDINNATKCFTQVTFMSLYHLPCLHVSSPIRNQCYSCPIWWVNDET